jgi:hypothetical protein
LAAPPEIRRRVLVVGLWALGALLAFACYLRLAETRAVNSDGAAQALQAWDMWHGNLLLHGWSLSDVSFYTTELPEYVLVELVRGLHADVVQVAAAITYTLAVLLVAILAKGTATGRAAAARVLIAVGVMLVPQLAQGINVLLSSPDHIGTSVPVLVAFVILDRARSRWYVPVALAVVLGWAAVADALVLVIGVLPVVLVCGVRVARAVLADRQPLRDQWYDFWLAAGALVAAGASVIMLRLVRSDGGFLLRHNTGHVIQSAGDLPHHLTIAGQGVLLLAGADFLGLKLTAATVFICLHLIGVVLIGLGVLAALRRFAGGLDLVSQLLVTAVVVNLAAYVLSTLPQTMYFTREIAPVLPLSAALAGRVLAGRVLAIKFAPTALLMVLAGYLAGLGYALSQPPVPPQNQQLTSWLESRHLSHGLSGYWQSNVVTLSSGGRVQVSAVYASGDSVFPYTWEANLRSYNARQATANFVVLAPQVAEYKGFNDAAPVLATFGRPAHTYRVGPYRVLVWNKNLLPDLGPRA